MTDLRRLAAFLAQFDGDQFPMIQFIEVSPSVLERLRSAGVAAAARRFGDVQMRVESNAALEDHMAILKFAGGSLGRWDMRGSDVYVLEARKM